MIRIPQEPEISLDEYYAQKLLKKDHCYVGARMRRPGLIPLLHLPGGAGGGVATAGSLEVPSCSSTCPESGLPASPQLWGSAALKTGSGRPGHTWRMETYHYRQVTRLLAVWPKH